MRELKKPHIESILRTLTEFNIDTLCLWEVTSLCNLALQGLNAQAEVERLHEALKMEQEKFQLETLRTSECSVLLRRWNAQARFHNHDNAWSGAESCEWCTLVGDSEKLLAAPVNLGRAAQEPSPMHPIDEAKKRANEMLPGVFKAGQEPKPWMLILKPDCWD